MAEVEPTPWNYGRALLKQYGFDPERVASFTWERTPDGEEYISNVRYRPAVVMERRDG